AMLNTDPKRVYLSGFSGGAFMTSSAGAWLSDVVAAIAVASGGLGYPTTSPLLPILQSPVAVIEFHSQYDAFPVCGYWAPNTPITGAYVVPSQDQTFDFWTQANNCQTVTAATFCTGGQTTPPVGVNGTQTGVLERDATGCNGGVAITHYILPTGTHRMY